MIKLLCEKAPNSVFITEITEKQFLIDGYQVADGLLEGVMFEITFDSDGSITNIQVEEDSKDYFEQFNQDKFYQMVREKAEKILQKGDEVNISQHLKDKYYINGINCAYIIVE